MKRIRKVCLFALLFAGTVALGQDQSEKISASVSSTDLTQFKLSIYGGPSQSGIRHLADQAEAGRVKELFELAEWEDAKVEMIRRPDYRVEFVNSNPAAGDDERFVYALWITSSRKHVEVIIEGSHKYTSLPVEHSAWLIPLLEDKDRLSPIEVSTFECRSSLP